MKADDRGNIFSLLEEKYPYERCKNWVKTNFWHLISTFPVYLNKESS
jgi:hypothetical protein